MSQASQTHYRTCNLCEAMCGIKIEYRGKEILSIKGDKDDPFSQGHICPKAVALQDIYHDPDRLRKPVKKVAAGWQEIGWDEAFELTVAGLKAAQMKYDRDAVGIYLGNPNVHNVGSMLYGSGFIRSLRTRNRFSATSVDQLPHHTAGLAMFGHQMMLPIPDIDRTSYMLILGANPVTSNGSIMTAGGAERRLKAIQARGGKIVVVDPRRSETARLADQHIFVRPGSDALLLLALNHVLFADGFADPGKLAGHIDGWADFADAVAPYTPERVAAACGVPAATIRHIAHDFATADKAVCYGRMGVSTQAYGGLCQWLINALNVVTGNCDVPGGAMFTLPAFDVVGITSMSGNRGRTGRWHSRVRNLPEFNGELPCATLAEEITTPGEGQIHALVTMAGNPVLSTPNGGQLDAALSQLDFMVAIDIYINETTRHANVILPPTTGLETGHFDLVFNVFAVRNTVKYSPPLFAPEADARHDWQILHELRARLEGWHGQPVKRDKRSKFDFTKRLEPEAIIDLALRFGPYGAHGANLRGTGLTMRRLQAHPHGLDLGPLQPVLPERLGTSEGKVNLAPKTFLADLPRLEKTLSANGASKWPLRLIGRRQLRSNNSWMHNSVRLVRGKDRCTVLIHPRDADQYDIVDGQTVAVSSRVGTVTLPAEISDEIMTGVVSIPHGWGHNKRGARLQVAAAYPGVSANDLTDDQFLDDLTGNAALSGVPVSIRPIN